MCSHDLTSTPIARAVLPSLDEIDAEPLPTHRSTGTALSRHVDDIFQLTWSTTQKDAIIEAIRAATPLAKLLPTPADRRAAHECRPRRSILGPGFALDSLRTATRSCWTWLF